MSTAIHIERVTKTYRANELVVALDDVSLAAEPGEAVSIVGPNGAGKSTLLKIVAGIVSPTAGAVQRRGRCASIIELGAGFHADLTVRENVQVGLALAGLPRRRTDVDEVIDFAGISTAADRAVRHLSSGMLARLACAVAVHGRPDVLLMDEVLAVGDAAFQDEILTRVDGMVAEGCTLVLVTHSMHLALRATRRTVWIDEGRIMDDGPVDTVVARYEEASQGRARAGDSPLRIQRIVVDPDHIEPGGSATIVVDLACSETTRSVDIRVEARPVVGDDKGWMRTTDAPPESHLHTRVAATYPARIRSIGRGAHRVAITLAEVPISSTLLELTVLVSDHRNRLLDEASADLAIGSTPRRPQFDLRVTST